MKIYRMIGSLFLFLEVAFCGWAEVKGTQDISFIYYHVEGNIDNSFHPKNDHNYLYEGTVDYTLPVLGAEEFYGSISYRSTNDRTVDTEDFSIEKLYTGIKGNNFDFLVGDYYAEFSDYSLNNALKGVKLELGSEEAYKLVVLAGVDIAKWEDLWEDHWDSSGSKRYVWGVSLQNKFLNQALELNFNYGGAVDDKAFISADTAPLLINVLSINGSYRMNEKLKFDFEMGHSFTDTDERSDTAKTKTDNAYMLAANYEATPCSLNLKYERVGRYFNTTGGFSSQDTEGISFDSMWFLPHSTKLSFYVNTDRDNLDGENSATTRQWNPGVKFEFKLPKEVSANIGFDLRKRHTSDDSVNENTYTYSLGLDKDFGIVDAGFDYSRMIVRNKPSPEEERISDEYTLDLSGDFKIKEAKLNWGFSETITHDNYRQVKEADFILSHSLSLKLSFPSSLSFEAKATVGDNNYYQNEQDSNTYDYIFTVSRTLRDNLAFYLSYEKKSYSYWDDAQNYSETILTCKFSYVF